MNQPQNDWHSPFWKRIWKPSATISKQAEKLKETFYSQGFVGPLSLSSVNQLDLDFLWTSLGLGNTQNLPTDPMGRNRHLDLDQVRTLCEDSVLKSVLINVMGEDWQIWRTQFFSFSKKTQEFVWHCDNYGKINHQVSVHVSLGGSTRRNCLLVLPRSHLLYPSQIQAKYGLEFDGTDQNNNPRFRGSVKWGKSSKILLSSGEFIVMHPFLLHRSHSKTQSERRVFAIRLENK